MLRRTLPAWLRRLIGMDGWRLGLRGRRRRGWRQCRCWRCSLTDGWASRRCTGIRWCGWGAGWRGRARGWRRRSTWCTCCRRRSCSGLLQDWVLTQPAPLAALALGMALKPLLAWELLRAEVLAVEAALESGVAAGQVRLARLVSREVRTLTGAQVREGAIESLAENLADSLIAPLLWFALLGLPGAALYRFANTADAMWGYPGVREGRDWQWAGKWAARADDVLSWLPARLAAAALAAAAGQAGNGAFWRATAQQAQRTPSPNGGWPMGAMALLLGVRLGKPGAYTLNEAARAPQPADTRRACVLAASAAWGAAVLASCALLAVATV